jgi:hypothetical protein
MSAPLTTLRRHRGDDLAEWALSKRGRENLALVVLAAACITGIVLIGWL